MGPGPARDDALEDNLKLGERLDNIEFCSVAQAGCDRPCRTSPYWGTPKGINDTRRQIMSH